MPYNGSLCTERVNVRKNFTVELSSFTTRKIRKKYGPLAGNENTSAIT